MRNPSSYCCRGLWSSKCRSIVRPHKIMENPQSFTSSIAIWIKFNFSFSTLCARTAIDPIPANDQDYFQKIPVECKTDVVEENQRILRDEGSKCSVHERLRWYSWILGWCSKGSLNEGKGIHGQLIKYGIDPDLHLWNSLVNFYAKCGRFGDAFKVLDEMPERDAVSWSSLIAGVVDEGRGIDGIALFCEMWKDGVRANGFTLACSLKACALSLDLRFGRRLHAEIVKIGVASDMYVGSALVDLYARCGEVKLSRMVFDCIPERNAVLWNSMLNGYAEMGYGEEVLELFNRLTEKEVKFSKFTLSIVLKACANSEMVRAGHAMHSIVIRAGYELNEFIACNLLHIYSEFGLLEDTLKIFLSIENHNIVAWTTMMNCLNWQGESQEAAKLFCQMRREGGEPNEYILASLVSVASDLGDLHFCGSVHASICKSGFGSSVFLNNSLVTMYMNIGSVGDGYQVFQAMEARDSASWNTLLSGFSDNCAFEQGLSVFKQMLVEGLKLDDYTFVSILRCCTGVESVSFGKQVHTHTMKCCFGANCFVGTALIDMYCNGQLLQDGVKVFETLEKRDLTTWTVITSGYAKNNLGEKVISCFTEMLREGTKPSEFILSIGLSSCSSMGKLECGQLFHCFIVKTGYLEYMYIVSSLVDMYGRCGHMEDAEDVFRSSDMQNIVSWNAIIYGFTHNGQGEKALGLFRLMLDEGVNPDQVTFIGVLSACSHLGLVDEGIEHFKSMTSIYGIVPTIEHYACIVNILSRAGMLDEVKIFMEVMHLTENKLIWETILWASKMHEAVKFGETALKELVELNSETEHNYITLSHIFAATGRWDDAEKVRECMSSMGIRKDPGSSCVVIGDQAHIFYAQDNSHPHIQEVRFILQGLSHQSNQHTTPPA